MPRFVVDLERLKYLHCGLGQFSLHFGRALLAAAPDDWEPVFLIPPQAESLFSSRPRILTANVWRKEELHQWLRPLTAFWRHLPLNDLWHVTHQDSKYWPLDPRVPVVLTIHDLNFLRTKPVRVIRRRLRKLQSKIDRATVLASGSAHAAGEIREHFHLNDKPLHVIPNGVCLDSAVVPARPAIATDGARFLFTLGDIRPSKNFHVLVDMLAHLPGLTLIIAGSKQDPYAAAIERRASEAGLADRVKLPGRITDGERLWLYQHCEALVFPSLAEGFGLPLIEAMQCGRPVFSSRCTSLPEVGGSLAFYWDTFDAESMAAAVRNGLQQFATDASYADRLRAWANQFTWSRAASAYLDLYQGLLSGFKSGSRPAA